MASLDKLLKNKKDSSQDKWLLKSINDHLKQVQRPARKGVFYPSALGSECDRYLYNCYNGLVVREEITAVSRRIFDCGDYLGYRFEEYFKSMGILLETETQILSDDPPISGRLDFLIDHQVYGKYVIELKSINQRNFILLNKPKPEHVIQLQIYLNLTGYEIGSVLYENKNDQKIKAFILKKDVEHWNKIKTRCETIMAMEEQPNKCTGNNWCACKREKNE